MNAFKHLVTVKTQFVCLSMLHVTVLKTIWKVPTLDVAVETARVMKRYANALRISYNELIII